jgi:hypothetical protein
MTPRFIGDYLPIILQLGVTIWLATVARKFQVTMTSYVPRLQAHQEAVRRSRRLWWLNHEKDADWTEVMNEMMDWLSINEVYLEPAAVDGFKKIHLWKGLQASVGRMHPGGLKQEFEEAEKGSETLRQELLKFRRR